MPHQKLKVQHLQSDQHSWPQTLHSQDGLYLFVSICNTLNAVQVSKTESVVGKKPLEEEQGSKGEKLDSLQNKLAKVSKEHKEKVDMLEQEKKEVVVKCKAFDAQVAELKGALHSRAESAAKLNIKNAEANSHIQKLEAKLADLEASSKDRKAETTAK